MLDLDSGRSIRSATRAGWNTFLGHPPDRYRRSFRAEFDRRVRNALLPDSAILDVGSGRVPTLSRQERPTGCRYTGLDISRSELDRATSGSYDDHVAADVSELIPSLSGCYDLAVSFQVFEHVKPLDKALENLRSYLRPGGRLVAQMSGTFSLFGLANRLTPQPISVWLLRALHDRNPESIYPAHYHRCWYDALVASLSGWSRVEVIPWWWGAPYFRFLRALHAGYIAYEEWARFGGHRNLAPFYIVDAVR